MKKIVLVLALCVVAVGTMSAQFRLDVNASVPVYFGFTSEVTGTIGDVADFMFIIPELDIGYQFDLSMLKLGVGIRVLSFFGLVNLLTPEIFSELHLDPFVLRVGVAGGAALVFSPLGAADFETGAIFVPDVSVNIKLADIFRIG
ncbi:MAG TPA: hypothetical protein ENN69_01205, partial [Spirochaetia bacterium]|nr:hypothetical protein [Spirochaetia bacterium]